MMFPETRPTLVFTPNLIFFGTQSRHFWADICRPNSTPKLKFYAQDFEMISSEHERDIQIATTMNL